MMDVPLPVGVNQTLGGCPRIEVVARESCFESGFSDFLRRIAGSSTKIIGKPGQN